MKINNKVTITYEHIIHYAHRIHNQRLVDAEPKCRRIHGHSGKIVATFEGPLDPETGMIVDFYYIKKVFDKINEQLDHRLLISEFDKEMKEIAPMLPADSVVILPIPVVSCEFLSLYLLRRINEELENMGFSHVKCIRVEFWETEKAYATAEQT